ncbi:MAG TPA: hypothetical protein VIK06_09705 [Candidatus Limnocylindrales bacterium]
MRVRVFELRLLAVVLSVLWAAGGGVALIAYRPGGPVDLLVGLAALLPLPVSVASAVWPPLVRGDRAAAGVFWLGLGAGLLLVPSIGSITSQVVAGGAEPLLPSPEVVYPWTLALLATSLFTGIGLTRSFFPNPGAGRRRLAASIAFALVTTTAIGTAFAGVSLADNAALNSRPETVSRFGPTSPKLTPPSCNRALTPAATSTVVLELWGDVDGRGVGRVDLAGKRSGSDVSWTAQAGRTASADTQYGVIRVGSSAWSEQTGSSWAGIFLDETRNDLLDKTVFDVALTAGNRATAEDRGFDYVEGARARHCAIVIDGETFAAAFPQMAWLTGNADVGMWRGQLEYWVFGDGEVGKALGSVNGSAQDILPHGLLATMEVSMTATDRDAPVSIAPPNA